MSAKVASSQSNDQNVKIVTVGWWVLRGAGAGAGRRACPGGLTNAPAWRHLASLSSLTAWSTLPLLLSLSPAGPPCPDLRCAALTGPLLQVSPTVKAVAGSIGGVVEACMLQPIDVMKTRLQLDHSGQYKGEQAGSTRVNRQAGTLGCVCPCAYARRRPLQQNPCGVLGQQPSGRPALLLCLQA